MKGYEAQNPGATINWNGRLPSEGVPDPSARPEPTLASIESLVNNAGRDLMAGFDAHPVPGVMGSPNSPTPHVDTYAHNLINSVLGTND